MLSIRNNMEKLIQERLQDKLELIDEFYDAIEKFDRICVFRHEKPDYDAFGSQLGMESFIKDNWPNKEVISVGDDHVTLTGKCFPPMKQYDDSWFEQDFLAIILDLSNLDRISDERASKAKFIVKIDHHPLVEHFSDIEIVDETMSAAAELIASIFFSKEEKYKISATTCEYLYKGIVGDSGRFLYESTTAHTFLIAKKILEAGVDLSKVYHEIYDNDKNELLVRTYILKHYKVTPHGVAYYVLTDKLLKKFHLQPIQGKENVNIFAHFTGINAWLSITEDKKKGNWRVSIRSAGTPIDKLAEKYGGGGHAQASATKFKTKKEVKDFISALDSLFE